MAVCSGWRHGRMQRLAAWPYVAVGSQAICSSEKGEAVTKLYPLLVFPNFVIGLGKQSILIVFLYSSPMIIIVYILDLLMVHI